MERLKAQIRQTGPLSIDQYMSLCLHDPDGGYYATRPRLGEAGDFITAPMISQMFGELIGAWSAETWIRLGRPERLIWAEAGPGDASLMQDALRAARAAPGFLQAAELWLVEPSGPLRRIQQEKIGEGRWTSSLQELPEDAPLILIANEVLDCLPARQFVRTGSGWAERMVGLDADGALAFGLAARPLELLAPDAEPGSVLEVSAAQAAFGSEIGARVARQGGAALLIDYGRAEPGFGDTLQALKGHAKQGPLEAPGEADLTVHADFPAVMAAARAEGAAAAILTQGELLVRLGVLQRAEVLARARPDMAGSLQRQLDRLVGDEQMGELFKAACLSQPGLAAPGFEAA